MSSAEKQKRFREKHADDDSYKEKESARKAAWYAANKAKKAESQRQYRQEKREQLLMDLAKEGLK